MQHILVQEAHTIKARTKGVGNESTTRMQTYKKEFEGHIATSPTTPSVAVGESQQGGAPLCHPPPQQLPCRSLRNETNLEGGVVDGLHMRARACQHTPAYSYAELAGARQSTNAQAQAFEQVRQVPPLTRIAPVQIQTSSLGHSQGGRRLSAASAASG